MKIRISSRGIFSIHVGSERGITLFMAAAGMFAMLGFIALAVDMGMLYTARADCQKVADAAALAGAKEAFLVPNSNPTQAATDAAISAARANYKPTTNYTNDDRLMAANIIVDNTDHTVQVRVTRTAANSNPVQTFFATIFGIAAVDVATTATAEVFVPAAFGNPPIGEKCVKPWFLPNRYDFDGNGPNPPRQIQSSDRGTLISIKQGQSALAWAPGQYLIATLPNNGAPPSCPNCGNGAQAGQGGDLYRQNIACCNRNPIWCGMSIPFDTDNGNKVGPTGQGIDCLINQGPGNSGGQDILVHPVFTGDSNPLTITTGSNNPIGGGLTVTDSSSLIMVPLFDPLTNPLGSGQSTVTVNGFMQIFVKNEHNPQNTVDAYIIQVLTCNASGGGGGGGGTPISGPLGNPLPLRLVRNAGT